MKQFRLIFTFAIISLFFGCEKKENLPQMSDSFQDEQPKKKAGETLYCMNVDTEIFLQFENKKGQNLLDSTVKRAYNIKDISFDYVAGGSLVKAKLYVKNNILTLFTRYSYDNLIESTPTYKTYEHLAYLKLSDTDIDTIKVHSKEVPCSYYVSKVWYNGKLVAPSEVDTSNPITIIKKDM